MIITDIFTYNGSADADTVSFQSHLDSLAVFSHLDLESK